MGVVHVKESSDGELAGQMNKMGYWSLHHQVGKLKSKMENPGKWNVQAQEMETRQTAAGLAEIMLELLKPVTDIVL